jgi:hypothetical protein
MLGNQKVPQQRPKSKISSCPSFGRSLSAALIIACAAFAADARASDTHALELRLGQPVPESIVGPLTRLTDGAVIPIIGATQLWDIMPGAYVNGDRIVLIRADDSVAGRALSTVGLPIEDDRDRSKAQRALAFDDLSLVVHVWSKVDRWQWPWVTNAGYWTGLAGMCQRVNPARDGFAYDRDQHAYINDDKKPIAFGEPKNGESAKSVNIGDLVSVNGRFAILVRDQGTPGLLDPSDEAVTASLAPDLTEGKPRVRAGAIGHLFGDEAIFLFKRDRSGAERIRNSPANLAAMSQMNASGQWSIAVGIILFTLVLIRKNRQWRRKTQDDYDESGQPRPTWLR